MTNQVIPAEAVEAARRELAKGAYQVDAKELPYADAARRALEAAAPHMAADAWSRGHHDGAVDMMLKMENDGAKTTPNPYVS